MFLLAHWLSVFTTDFSENIYKTFECRFILFGLQCSRTDVYNSRTLPIGVLRVAWIYRFQKDLYSKGLSININTSILHFPSLLNRWEIIYIWLIMINVKSPSIQSSNSNFVILSIYMCMHVKCSVVSELSRSYRSEAHALCPWDSPENNGLGCHSLH